LPAFSQNRSSDKLSKEERLGITGMFKYSNNSWDISKKAKYGELNFDSFRIWAQTDIGDKFFASIQYRFYEGWNMPQHFFVGYHLKNSTLKIGQTWVPFGLNWQTFDDWGNIAYYAGFQDDYDYGITWRKKTGDFTMDFGFFKNQQLSSKVTGRYDTDIYSGDITGNQKRNEETNQFNINVFWEKTISSYNIKLGASGMGGQIYNIDIDNFGSRFAGAVYARFNYNILHITAQDIFYDYKQVLPGNNSVDKNFINVCSWEIAYEIPSKSNIFTSSIAVDLFKDKITVYNNFSLLSGGNSINNSMLITNGLRTFFGHIEVFFEGYYGIGDPQLSGNALAIVRYKTS